MSKIKERFEETQFAKGGGLSFEASDFEGMHADLKAFFHQELLTLAELVEKQKRLPTEDQEYGLDEDNAFDDGIDNAAALIRAKAAELLQ